MDEDATRIWLAHWHQSTTARRGRWLDVVTRELSNGNVWNAAIEMIDGQLRLVCRWGEVDDPHTVALVSTQSKANEVVLRTPYGYYTAASLDELRALMAQLITTAAAGWDQTDQVA